MRPWKMSRATSSAVIRSGISTSLAVMASAARDTISKAAHGLGGDGAQLGADALLVRAGVQGAAETRRRQELLAGQSGVVAGVARLVRAGIAAVGHGRLQGQGWL